MSGDVVRSISEDGQKFSGSDVKLQGGRVGAFKGRHHHWHDIV
jgi:hypothetical protein